MMDQRRFPTSSSRCRWNSVIWQAESLVRGQTRLEKELGQFFESTLAHATQAKPIDLPILSCLPSFSLLCLL